MRLIRIFGVSVNSMNLKGRLAVISAAVCFSSLSACGGGGSTEDSAQASAATELVAKAGYPGALTLEVSTSQVSIATAGQGRPQQGFSQADWFPVGSISKPFTATLAAVLVQEGKMNWDTKISDVLPELRTTMRPEYQSVTLKDLLGHQSGVFPAVTPAEISQLPTLTGNDVQQRLQLASWALGRSPSVAPTKQFEYSNGGFVVAASMIERVGGASYETLLQARVLQPLGIQARFGATGNQPDEVLGHVYSAGKWTPLPATAPEAQFPAVANPAGGLKLTGAGLAKFLQMHLRALKGQSGELLSASTAQKLHQAMAFDNELGWFSGKDLAGRALSFHAGSDDYSYYAIAALTKSGEKAAFVFVNGWRDQSESDASATLANMLK